MTVIKQNGEREPYNIEKIRRSIQKAAIDAGLPTNAVDDAAAQITEKVASWAKGRADLKTGEIRKFVLRELEKKDKAIADSWKRFDTKFKN